MNTAEQLERITISRDQTGRVKTATLTFHFQDQAKLCVYKVALTDWTRMNPYGTDDEIVKSDYLKDIVQKQISAHESFINWQSQNFLPVTQPTGHM